LKLLLGEDVEVNVDLNEEDDDGMSDEDHEDNDSECDGNEDFLEVEGEEEE
jgi:hypothetical protein